MSARRFGFATLARVLFVAALLLGPAAGFASAQLFGKNGLSLPSVPALKPPKIEIPTPKPPKIEVPSVNLPKPPKINDLSLPPKINVPKPTLPKPPKVEIPTVKPPTVTLPKPPAINVPPVNLPKPPSVKVPKPPSINVPSVNLPKPPKIDVPSIKIPPLIVLRPPQGSTLPVEPDYPRPPVKPQNTTPSGPPLGQQVDGIVTPPKPQPPLPQPLPQPPIIVIPPVQPPVKPQPPVVPPQPQPPVNPQPMPEPEPQPQPDPEPQAMPATEGNALRVKERVLDAAAANAGIELGDILIMVGETRVKTEADLTAALSAAKGKVVVTYFNPRDNKVETRELTPDAGSIGVKVEPVTVDLQEDEAKPQPEPEPTGPTAVQLTEVTARSSAARAGIQVGDVIVAVGGKRISTPAELTAALKAAGDEAEVMYVNPEDGKFETKKLKVTEGSIGVKGKAVAVSEK
ncbi:MAG: PDZ domain-containing protein [Planctomycetes bacterium]|nr:PDZ domain-containing protein [Planctomycetota bacterium]